VWFCWQFRPCDKYTGQLLAHPLKEGKQLANSTIIF
jgi:hypothetical protein